MYSETIKTLRKEKNISQTELAKILDMPRYIISNWEQGRTEPNITDLITIANFFECSIDYLLGRSDDFGIINIQNEKKQLNKNEKEILDIFNSIPSESQAQLLEYARYCQMKSQDFNKTNNQRRA